MRRPARLVVGGAVLAAAAAVAAALAGPAIVAEPSLVDFGETAGRSSRVVEVRNAGWGLLRVLAVSSSCGCTTAAIDATAILPRRTARLVVTFDRAAHGPQTGPARHAVYVRSNDRRSPEIEIGIRAIVLGTAP